MAKIHNLLERAKKLEKKHASKFRELPTIISGSKCKHAEVVCPCRCKEHSLESETFPENCVCRQFHKPSKKPCGCLTKQDFKLITDNLVYNQVVYIFGGETGPDASRIVPGMFKFYNKSCNGGNQSFEIFKRGKQIIKSNGKEKILATIP